MYTTRLHAVPCSRTWRTTCRNVVVHATVDMYGHCPTSSADMADRIKIPPDVVIDVDSARRWNQDAAP